MTLGYHNPKKLTTNIQEQSWVAQDIYRRLQENVSECYGTGKTKNGKPAFLNNISSRNVDPSATDFVSRVPTHVPAPSMTVRIAGGNFLNVSSMLQKSVSQVKQKPGTTQAAQGTTASKKVAETTFARAIIGKRNSETSEPAATSNKVTGQSKNASESNRENDTISEKNREDVERKDEESAID